MLTYGGKDMKTTEIKNLEFVENKRENILIAPLDKSEHYDVVLAVVKPRETLSPHKHLRPDNGDEIFLFYKGGEFEVRTDTSSKTFRTQNPIMVRFRSLEPHSIINLADSELRFFAFYVPPFDPEEVKAVSLR